MGSSEGSEAEAIRDFLAQPHRDYDEDLATQEKNSVLGPKSNFMKRLYHFLFEANPSQYSSIAPRKADGTRTKILFFNGNGRGR